MKILYGINDSEILHGDDIGECVRDYFSEFEDGGIPETVIVKQYQPMQVSDWFFDRQIESITENLWDEYGNPDADPSLPSEAVAAWNKFKDAVNTHYHSWQCEEIGEPIKVLTADYVD